MTQRYYRRVIRIKATDSPNVRLALAQIRAGEVPTGEELVPGVLGYAEYQRRLETWDAVRQCYGLDAEFYVGAELLLFPPEWLNYAEQVALGLSRRERKARGVGIDPAEGGDKTAMAAVDEYGVLEMVSVKTPDTSIIEGRVIAFLDKHGVPGDRCCIDRGGGGKQLADNLRARVFPGVGNRLRGIRTVGFGEAPTLEVKRGAHLLDARRNIIEERGTFVSRRAEMYWDLSNLLDPARERLIDPRLSPAKGFGIPAVGVGDLRRQLAVIPKLYDRDGGRLRLPPKNRTGTTHKGEKTLIELIGHSPDEADALVLAVHAMLHRGAAKRQGVVV